MKEHLNLFDTTAMETRNAASVQAEHNDEERDPHRYNKAEVETRNAVSVLHDGSVKRKSACCHGAIEGNAALYGRAEEDQCRIAIIKHGSGEKINLERLDTTDMKKTNAA
ncbi:unnamed protein product [Haemonchus placei]|uniref:PPM-type phosphatase domain-containing protein n=1 Tax=Haemonchus placei TaxID=6290 RepID=A0A0N4WEC5_HAEPC|nr:unnamed protein product [Haemonchus placei]